MKIDPKLTQAISDWLNTPEQERDIRAGAEIMLSLNRNRALYNSIMRNPEKFTPKLVYELRKFLKIRLDRKAVADVVRLESVVMPRVEMTLSSHPVISSDEDLPDGKIAKGKRADHDSLSADIRALWDSGGSMHQRIDVLFNELKNMADSQPCDRYEKLRLLDEADKAYRKNLELYDSFVAPSSEADASEEDYSGVAEKASSKEASSSADVIKAVNAARKTISKYRKLVSTMNLDDPKRLPAIEKLQNAVNVILSSGSDLAEATKTELQALGITFN